jgi:hypothetical protein
MISLPEDAWQRLHRLESVEAIRNLVGLYALAADRRNDPAIFGQIFADDIIWEAEGFGRHEGHETVIAELARIGQESIVWTLHCMTSPIVEINSDGSHARCRWWLWELSKIASVSGEEPVAHFLGGMYDSQLRHMADDWRFSHVRLNLSLFSPHTAGFKTLP